VHNFKCVLLYILIIGVGATLCHPGQSYNPAETDHEEVVAAAVALELKRTEINKAANTPLSTGLSEHTLSLLLGDVSTLSDDSIL
jgi:Nop53 (60S ribosomal biogenesis)